MNERLGVNVFDAGDELIGEQKDSLQGELAVAEVEEILQARPKQIEDHGIVVTFGTEPTNKRDANTSSQGLVDTSLIFQLRMLGLDTFKFDGNFFSRDDIGAQIDVTKTSTSDFSADTVLVADPKILITPNVSLYLSDASQQADRKSLTCTATREGGI